MVDYATTLFIPSLHGQYKVWKNDLESVVKSSDEIIQMGNLIGCTDFAKDNSQSGPNEAVLKFTVIQKARLDNWTQLIGPNEIMALNFPDEWTNDSSNHILRTGWLSEDGVFKVSTVNKNRLVTHGGLTYGEWLSIGSPQTAQEASDRLNEKYLATVYQGSCFNLGDPPNYAANPIWADPVMELIPSWITAPVACPFDQLHGSGSLNTPEGRAQCNNKVSPVHYVDKIRFNTSGAISVIKGAEISSIDYNLPGEIITSIPRPFRMYVEKTPITN